MICAKQVDKQTAFSCDNSGKKKVTSNKLMERGQTDELFGKQQKLNYAREKGSWLGLQLPKILCCKLLSIFLKEKYIYDYLSILKTDN